MKQLKNDFVRRVATLTLLSGLLSGAAFQVYPTPRQTPPEGEAARHQVSIPSPGEGSSSTGKIAFSSGLDIYTINPDGSGLTELTRESGAEFNLQPIWSPDRTQIAFVSKRQGNVDIYVMKANGDSVRRLTSNPGEDSQPDWSPDGNRIAFVRGDDPSFAGKINTSLCEPADIYVVNADGSGAPVMLAGVGDNTDPAWSPDGSHIAFSSNREDDNYEIYTMNADGKNVTRLTFNTVGDADPSWSPDGSRIAYGSGYQISSIFCGIDGIIQNPLGPDLNGSGEGPDIHLIKKDGSDDVQLTATKSSSDPTWSPDGKMIAFTTNRDGNFDIYVIDVAARVQKALAYSPFHDWSPSWSSGFIFPDTPTGGAVEEAAQSPPGR